MNDKKGDRPPPAVLSGPPEPDLEQKLKQHPNDADLKADVGSDESMDASDPPSVTRPGCEDDEPAPSSGFPE